MKGGPHERLVPGLLPKEHLVCTPFARAALRLPWGPPPAALGGAFPVPANQPLDEQLGAGGGIFGLWDLGKGQRGDPWLQVAEALGCCTLSLRTKTTRTGRDAFWSHPSSTDPHGREGPGMDLPESSHFLHHTLPC